MSFIRQFLVVRQLSATAIIVCFAAVPLSALADEPRLPESITSFTQTFCLKCHNKEEPEAQLDFSVFATTGDMAARHQTWQEVIHRLELGEMPPADHSPRPSFEECREVIDAVRSILKSEAIKNAGDPGSVPVRRLSNAEYNYTIRDLTGVDIRPAREFPVDPANEAGFDNSAESLSISPALLNKYLAAAREVVQHLVLKPQGFDFAPHPVVTDTDRDKYCVNRIVKFYQRQPTSPADYFLAAWQVRISGGDPDLVLPETAASLGVSPKYLATVWNLLTDEQQNAGPIQALRSMWLGLPQEAGQQPMAREGCRQMSEFVTSLRQRLEPKVEGLNVEGVHKGSQTFVLWKNDQYAAGRRRYDSAALIKTPESPPESAVESSLIVPTDEDEQRRFLEAMERFASIFPDAFYVSERGRDYVGVPREKQEKGRLLSAGFHSMMGYYRDDAPLCELILNDAEKGELDALWQELDFITSAPMRQYTGFVWFERTDSAWMRDPEFDFARAEDRSVTSEDMIKQLAEVYLAKARRHGGTEIPLQAIEDYFTNINRQIRWVEAARLKAESSHLQALEDFAARCYRRPLTQAEQQELRSWYNARRSEDGLSHEEAVQDAIVSLLMSPLFFYRTDLAGSADVTTSLDAVDKAESAMRREALNDFELASRLSYFLWSSMPDERLLQLASEGRLHEREVLLSETRRMLQHDRAQALAVEFAGNWLGFRRFEEHNSVDRERFPQFTDALRSAMFEEPVRFLTDIIRNDRSVLECLYADYAIVNAELARHYGLDFPPGNDSWIRIENVGDKSRGGLIPMSVFLTQNSPGLRTSPVKRGYWVVRKLLGEHIPAPPPNVPDLPEDESRPGELTMRDTLARHREHISCAGCHDRFDSIGLIFENFGPIGELRSLDLGGRPVETLATLPDGTSGRNLKDLQRYIEVHRQEDFLKTFCRKLLAFGLGRTLLLSDDLLIDEMASMLRDHNERFSSLIESIVMSRQFRTRRASLLIEVGTNTSTE